MTGSVTKLQDRITACRACPRLTKYLSVIREKYPGYWCKPVPLFGDLKARVLLLGLAPGRFGSNRTGRMFTGDASGEFLFRALYELGLASQQGSTHASDGLTLRDVVITAVARCAPPQNKPAPDELARCARFFEAEIIQLATVRVVVALGRIAHDQFLKWKIRTENKNLNRAQFAFAHGAVHHFKDRPETLVDIYHPSRQNTNTGVLTMPMFKQGLKKAMRHAGV